MRLVLTVKQGNRKVRFGWRHWPLAWRFFKACLKYDYTAKYGLPIIYLSFVKVWPKGVDA